MIGDSMDCVAAYNTRIGNEDVIVILDWPAAGDQPNLPVT